MLKHKKKTSLNDGLKEYLTFVEDLDFSPAKEKNYKRIAQEFLAFCKNKELNTETLEDFLNSKGLTETTRYTYRGYVHYFLDFLYKNGYIPSLVKVDLPLPAVKKFKLEISDQVLEHLLSFIETPRDKMLILLLSISGLTQNEIVLLKKKDIDLKHNQISSPTGKIGFLFPEWKVFISKYLSSLSTEEAYLFPVLKGNKETSMSSITANVVLRKISTRWKISGVVLEGIEAGISSKDLQLSALRRIKKSFPLEQIAERLKLKDLTNLYSI